MREEGKIITKLVNCSKCNTQEFFGRIGEECQYCRTNTQNHKTCTHDWRYSYPTPLGRGECGCEMHVFECFNCKMTVSCKEIPHEYCGYN